MLAVNKKMAFYYLWGKAQSDRLSKPEDRMFFAGVAIAMKALCIKKLRLKLLLPD
ncbi:hypothetical protein [Iodobacter fluviatilis]|uniref:hypothetical protein n=1 Tax=Iodobacter fluviatilis TaxID=537 RepID=UPI001558C2EF|nr:hypothetical protein [Iodobacter fluviatilis]